ncbi:XTP/dITP diphosphatase [Facklamia sp. P12932]|uniref:XTP/dITP diphosphatase n=1 Tax=Facklamia sp. P12932 TaxID=3421947 RepID=UPI003D17FFF2
MKLIIASHNPGKIAEFKALFEAFDLQVQSLLDYPEIPEVEETGTTFEENARLKAETIAKEMNCLALSDDSGLCVPALNNEPGVYSARYAGEEKNDERNRLKLLENLKEFNGDQRKAYFTTVIVLADPQKDSLVVEGNVEGIITKEPIGEGGFGYDSLFYYPQDQQTFAQISAERKNQISHRGQAVEKLKGKLNDWLEG